MGYVIFRGIGTEGSASVVGSSNVLSNVYVSKMPSHKKAEMRYTEYYIKGRDGALHVDEGYSNFDLSVSVVLMNAQAITRQRVNAWADGTGKLITSDDLSRCYRASVKEEVQWTRVSANGGFYDTAEITFTCEPCMYETNEEVQVFTSNGNLVNIGTAEAYPLIKVEGSGNASFSINGKTITINGMTNGVPVFIDSENGYVYNTISATTMVGDIPVLPMQTASLLAIPVNLISGVARLTITPHWRWV